MGKIEIGRKIVCFVCLAGLLAGCGAAENSEEKAPAETVEEAAETPAAEETAVNEETVASEEAAADEEAAAQKAAEKRAALTHVEKYMVDDFYGDKQEYEVYGPIGGECEDGYLFYWDHGITFSASVFSGGTTESLYLYMDNMAELEKEDWETESGYSNIQIGEVEKSGNNRYLFASWQAEDTYGTPYQKKKVLYLDVKGEGAAVLWELEISEIGMDEEASQIIAEMAQCYGVNLNELGISGDWASQDAQRQADRQDVYEPEDGEIALEKVDGYQYLGVTTLSLNDGTLQCPAMAPMGWQTEVQEDRIRANMHGVSINIYGLQISSLNYMGLVEKQADGDLRYRSDDEEHNRNVKRSEVMTMSGYEEAVYFIIDYDEKSHRDDNYYKKAEVNCYIRLDDKCLFVCEIKLRSEEYDSATNVLMKELETAYGIDMSAYYREEE